VVARTGAELMVGCCLMLPNCMLLIYQKSIGERGGKRRLLMGLVKKQHTADIPTIHSIPATRRHIPQTLLALYPQQISILIQ